MTDPTTPEAERLSVIIVTWNRRDEVVRTLGELGAQSMPFELVVVDNGSTDGSVDAARATRPDAIVVALPENTGPAYARNRGIETATGDIIVFLDDDASFESADALARFAKRFEKDERLGIIATNIRHATTGAPELGAIPRVDRRDPPRGDFDAAYFCGGGCAFRRTMCEDVGLFAEDYFYSCEELDLGWRALERGHRIVWAADIVVLHRKTEQARPGGQWVRMNMRNRLRLPMRFLPWRCVVTYAGVWWPQLFLAAVRTRQLGAFLRGFGGFCALIPATVLSRTRLSRETCERIRALDGRYFH
jgi:GT2 family glycosyltransferase